MIYGMDKTFYWLEALRRGCGKPVEISLKKFTAACYSGRLSLAAMRVWKDQFASI